MNDTIDRTNRSVLTVLGLLLAAAGIAGLIRGSAAADDRAADDPVLSDGLRRWVSENSEWFWPAAFLASLLVAWLAWRWLRRQLPLGPHVKAIDLTTDPTHGVTRVDAPAAAAAVERDIAAYPGVVGVKARIDREHAVPSFDLSVEVEDGTDLEALRRKIDEEALERFCEAFEISEFTADIQFRLKPRTGHLVA